MSAAAAAKKNAGPGYYDLIKEAVLELKERTGSSRHAIDKYVAAKKGASYSRSRLNIALKKGVETGKLVAVKGSFKLAADEKKAEKKKVVAKPAKKSVAAKAAKKTPTAKTAAVGKKDKSGAKKAAAKPKKAAAVKKSVKKVASTKKPTTTKKKVVKKSAAKKTSVKKSTEKKE
ncbi:hypothetical protein PINS_up012663 [Pythium insidiosum]|nr:hypothetical protein PINS_up012663 [Pythium insidiosum]